MKITKAYVLNLDLEPEDKDVSTMSDEGWIAEAERQAVFNYANCGIYSLENFQNALNGDTLSLENSYFRFIETDND